MINSMQIVSNQFNKTGFDTKGKINVVKKISIAKVGNLIQDQPTDQL